MNLIFKWLEINASIEGIVNGSYFYITALLKKKLSHVTLLVLVTWVLAGNTLQITSAKIGDRLDLNPRPRVKSPAR